MNQLLHTIAETCQITSIGRTKIYELITSGEPPARKVGKKTLIAREDLKRWADQLPVVDVKDVVADRNTAAASLPSDVNTTSNLPDASISQPVAKHQGKGADHSGRDPAFARKRPTSGLSSPWRCR